MEQKYLDAMRLLGETEDVELLTILGHYFTSKSEFIRCTDEINAEINAEIKKEQI